MEAFSPDIQVAETDIQTENIQLKLEVAQLKEQQLRQNERIVALENALQEANKLATIDTLTGVDNRRSIDTNLPREIAAAARRKGKLVVVMVDIDHFKELNDTYGHQWGDTVLKAVADTFKSTARTNDFVGRYGGEEFTLLLPEEDDVDLSNFNTSRFQEEIKKINRSPKGNDAPLTISLGATILDFSKSDGHNLPSAEKAIRAADNNLYASKKNGRDRLTVSEYSETVPTF